MDFILCFILYLYSVFRYDKQLQQIDGTLSTIEMQREALEGANTNTAVLTTMNDAAKALKKANADLDVDKVLNWRLILQIIKCGLVRLMT